MSERIIKTFESYGDHGWQWEFVTGGIGRTNKLGEGLFVITDKPNNYKVNQVKGTCQFSLPAERKAAMRKIRDYYRDTCEMVFDEIS